jgi:citrate lyase subunit beta/citryl-CoA lyase
LEVNVPRTHPRSFLFVPASRPDRFEKATGSGAHRVILDLEDAVAPEDKEAARGHVAQWEGRAAAVVRINGADTPWFAADIEMVRRGGVNMLMVPKASPEALDFVLGSLTSSCRVIALIETVEAYANLRTVCKNPIVSQLAFGNLDFGVDAGVTETARELDPVRLQIVLESRLAGLPAPIDGVTTTWSDADAFGAEVRSAKALGFGAKLCIHPAQVGLANNAFLPTPEEVAWAQRVIEATAVHSGAIAVDGKMVDAPVIDRARAILAEQNL